MSTEGGTEHLLRQLGPQVLGALVRRHGDFATAEDATQEALLAAATQWPEQGRPDNPFGWLIQVATRRLVDQIRRDDARRRREDLVAARSATDLPAADGQDDTLLLMELCCPPSLTPASAIPLALRAVGGLTTREIAAAFLVPEATMAQRISRAKARIRETGLATEAVLAGPGQAERLASVCHVLYLLFNEGYATSTGGDLTRTDLSGEAIRLTRAVRVERPDDPEVAGLLALMLLTDARRPARTGPDGELIPLADQDRTRWDQDLIAEGLALVTEALGHGAMGPYQVQAAIAGLHDQAGQAADTDWPQILVLYGLLERMTANPMVSLNRAVAVAMVQGPEAGLALLGDLEVHLGDHARLHAVRAHLLERADQPEAAIAEFRAAASRTTNQREQQFLTTQAARLTTALQQ